MSQEDIVLHDYFTSIAAGDVSAFDQFSHLYKHKIMGKAFQETQCWNAAEEITKGFFDNIWKSRTLLTAVENGDHYISTTLDHITKQYLLLKKNSTLLGELIKKFTSGLFTGPCLPMTEEQLKTFVPIAINTLPQQMKQVFELRYYYQEPYEDIARDLGITKGIAQQYFFDSMIQIRNYIDEHLLPG
ncbi:DNA-directed RNA polymerase specialized sigma subunit, sigma24 family [Filimonas lacunae]|uniref:DNA-directed RNA polymerase specialized sigma subunit, sigma24 family n=1 Tax=Filimonas lacunae TaxID=477680 RepID=A0A173MKZ1_9BACT|nr:sigma factor-like helix-turn-helix DNA-binding protein [Filimonas lacunae]BAV08147.1 hypothetical protein FLA_4180 [Filimonas lacunae]SIT09953.1 DNA-directed RNA polymerase specialized sigma subunit, sigma24 family [Filimonas lacunae]